MANVLGREKREQVLALGRLGWTLRRIEAETGVRRETASTYLKAAGIAHICMLTGDNAGTAKGIAEGLGLADYRAELLPGAPAADGVGEWLDGYLFALSGPIYAGTNEIQRNVIAERILGLPRT